MAKIELETDSSNLVDALKLWTFDYSPAGMLILEVRQLIDLEFVFCDVSFTPLSCNHYMCP